MARHQAQEPHREHAGARCLEHGGCCGMGGLKTGTPLHSTACLAPEGRGREVVTVDAFQRMSC